MSEEIFVRKQWFRTILGLGLLLLTAACEQKGSQKTSFSEMQDEGSISSHYEELKSLEWMIGEWKDDEKGIDISYTIDWGMNRNFLLQHFDSDISGSDAIQGDQVIGWDPSEKKVRSWVFDSDGGFGSSIWTNEGGNIWYSTMKYTLPDGRKASALHIYTKINDNSYTFASSNRDIGGELLPDIGPFKIIRTK